MKICLFIIIFAIIIAKDSLYVFIISLRLLVEKLIYIIESAFRSTLTDDETMKNDLCILLPLEGNLILN